MTKRAALRWWHVAAGSLLVAAILMLLIRRCLVAATDPPPLLRVVAAPPMGWGFEWYPILSALALVFAYARRSLKLVAFTQAMLLAAGFVHVLWIVGTVPGKVDLRFLQILLTGQAVAWTSYLCAATALAIGIRRRGVQDSA